MVTKHLSDFATPVVLSDPLPPMFTATGATVWIGMDTLAWSGADTTLTLNNGQCAQFMITGHFTAFGEFTNTATLDTDGAAAGPELSASATVNVVSTCAANTVIPDGAYASDGYTYLTGTVNIQGLFTVNEDVLVQNAEVFMEQGAEIVVLPGGQLYIHNSSVQSCLPVMWKGITAQGGSLVSVRGSFVGDAENAVTALDHSTLWLDNNQFHNNRTGISIPAVPWVAHNSVAVYLRRNTFYSQGPMPQPYPGQATAVGAVGFAAMDVHNTTLQLTAGGNIVHTLSNGIVAHGSVLGVSGFRMVNIQPDAAYAYTGNGAGIYANGQGSLSTLKQEGYGSDSTAPPSFEDCRWGIYAEYMNVKSTDNRMLGMGTAYRVDFGGYRRVHLLNNRVSTRYHGIDLRFNDGAQQVLVGQNDITFGNDPECILCRGYSGINVVEANSANPSSVIQGNVLHFVPLTSSRFGVRLTSANDWLVEGNQVIMASRFHSRTGIATNGCQRVQVSCNEVTNADALYAQYPIDAQAGLRNWLGQDLLISCNTVDRTTNGILFSGGSSNTELRGNEFHKHRWGLHLENAVIGEQPHRGNLWFEAAPANGFQAICVPPENAEFSPFFVNPAIAPSGGNPLPAIVSPPFGWFFPATGQNFSCDEEGECAGFRERCATCADSLWRKVATGTVENAAYTPETRWIMKGDLYRLLTEEPERLTGDTLFQAFYDQVGTDVLAQLKDLELEQSVLYRLDSSVTSALQAGAMQLDALRAQLREELAAMGDSSLTDTRGRPRLAIER